MQCIEKGSPSDCLLSCYDKRLAQADSLRRTNTCASTALCAEIGIDRILLTLRNCLNGALTLTSTACDTIITNYVCHNAINLNC